MRALTFAALLALAALVTPASASWFYAHIGNGFYGRTNGFCYDGWYYTRSFDCYGNAFFAKHSEFPRQTVSHCAPTINHCRTTSSDSSYDLKQALLSIIKKREEHQQNLELFKAAGVLAPNGATFGVTAPYPQLGNTVYSYGAFTPQPASQFNLDKLAERSERLGSQAMNVGTEFNSQFLGIVKQAGNNAAEVAAIQAKGLSAAAALNAASASGAGSSTTYHSAVSGSVTPTNSGTAAVSAAGPASADVGQVLVNNGCLTCHGPNDRQGNVDLSNYQSLSPAEWEHIFQMCTVPPDGKNRMPKGQPPLSMNDLKLIMQKAMGQ